jgi:hypothetical protein
MDYDSRFHGIPVNVTDAVHKVGVSIDDDGLVTTAEQRPVAIVAPVVPLGVYAVYVSHGTRNVGPGGLDEQVVVIPHQRACVNPDLPHFPAFPQNPVETEPINVIQEDLALVQSPIHDVVEASGDLQSQGPTHAPRLWRP